MWVHDRDTLDFAEVNDAAVRHYGYERAEFLARRVPDLAAAGESSEPSFAGASRHRLRDGGVIEVELVSHELPFGGRPAMIVAAQDVTKRNALEAELRHQASHDSLTGLANRALLSERIDQALARRRRDGRGLAVLLIDLDGFKAVNDDFGHAAGDDLLLAAAERIAGCVRAGDTAARLGGDEFVVLVENAVDPGEPCALAQRVIDALAEPLVFAGTRVSPQASVGIAVSQAGLADSDQLLRDADAAMYEAKRDDAGSYRVFGPAMDLAAPAKGRDRTWTTPVLPPRAVPTSG
jgi:diguanylate cyclase (GGDEF)-like protein